MEWPEIIWSPAAELPGIRQDMPGTGDDVSFGCMQLRGILQPACAHFRVRGLARDGISIAGKQPMSSLPVMQVDK